MNKAEALQKVLDLNRLAASTTHQGEKKNAEFQAQRLRLEHGISNADIVRGVGNDESSDFSFFGRRMFFSTQMQSFLDGIQNEIDLALQRLESLDSLNRMAETARFYTKVKELLGDTKAWRPRNARPSLLEQRNAAVRAFYNEELQRNAHGGEVTAHAHEMARNRAATWSDLRKDVIERIVGVSPDNLRMQEYWEQQEREGNMPARISLRRQNKRQRATAPPGYRWVDTETLKTDELPIHLQRERIKGPQVFDNFERKEKK